MPPLVTVLVASLLLQAPPREQHPAPVCPEVEYVELSRTSGPASREICVRPGLLTGFLFDTQVVMDLQEEVRFVGVLKGRSGISFKPPQDMGVGERLRLKVLIGGGAAQYETVFTLVAHGSGEATRQVEVHQDRRPRESLIQEIEWLQLKSHQLLVENDSLRDEVERTRNALQRAGGLTGAYLSGTLMAGGIGMLTTSQPPSQEPLYSREISTYRAANRVAVKVSILNLSADDWTAVGASLSDARVKLSEGWILSVAKPISPGTRGEVFLETKAGPDELKGSYTLTLWEDGPRTVTVAHVVFPR